VASLWQPCWVEFGQSSLLLGYGAAMTPADPMNQSNPDDATHDTSRLTRVVVSTVAVQAVIVMASLTIPVLAGLIGAAVGIPAYLVGYYSALIYGFAAATSVVTPRLFQRWGGIRLHQGILVMTATAMASLVTAMPILFVVSAVILGCAYGPMNPASTVMLARYTPARLRARIFSLKQTAVPAGGALAGFAAPTFATLLGWRGTMLLIAAICITVAALIQPWRDQLDGDSLCESCLRRLASAQSASHYAVSEPCSSAFPRFSRPFLSRSVGHCAMPGPCCRSP
jgi:MFS family permease